MRARADCMQVRKGVICRFLPPTRLLMRACYRVQPVKDDSSIRRALANSVLTEHPPRRKTHAFARRASTVRPFINSIAIRRYRRKTWCEPILTITHAPHPSQIVATRYHKRPLKLRFGSVITITHVSHVTPITARGYHKKPRFGPTVTIMHVSHVT